MSYYPRPPHMPKFRFTSKTILWFLAGIAITASSVYWWGVQSTLIPGNTPIALAFTAILVGAPPSLMSFLIPWSPGGMLLQKVHARTWGYVVIVGACIYLLYYSFQIQYSWWAAQRIVAESNLIYQQVFIGMIGFIIIPALLFAPVSDAELVEQVRQAHLVKRYELQTQADIAILRASLLRAQEKALVGFANLTTEEREELAAVMRSLVGGIDRTLHEVGRTVKAVSGVAMPFDGMLEDNEDIRDVLEYISESLTSSSLTVRNGNGEEVAAKDFSQPRDTGRFERVQTIPMVSFRDPRTGNILRAPLEGHDSLGNPIIRLKNGDHKPISKSWVVND